jgi:hypothetical protein
MSSYYKLLIITTLLFLLFTFTTSTGLLSLAGSWPARSGDAQHTGRSLAVGPGIGGAVCLWASPLLGSALSTSPVIGIGGTIYVGTTGGRVAALSSNGRLLWNFSVGAQVNDALALTDDGRVMIATNAGRLIALDVLTGLLNFTYTTPAASPIPGAPTVASNGFIFFGARDGYAYALNTTGGLAWRFYAGSVISTSPALSHDGATVYFATEDSTSKLWALDVNSGAVKWSFKAANAMYASPLVMSDGSVIISTARYSNYLMHKINATSGAQIWSSNINSNGFSSPSIGLNGIIYMGRRCCDDGMIAINSSSGAAVWSFQASSYYDATPLIGADNTVYVRAGNKVFALVGATGSTIFSQSINMTGDTSLVLAADGTLIVGDATGVVRGFGPMPSPSITASPSPSPSISRTPSVSFTSSPSPTFYPYPDDGFLTSANLTWFSTSGPGQATFDSDTCVRACSRLGYTLSRIDRATGAMGPMQGSKKPQYFQCCGFLCLGSCAVDCTCPSGTIARPLFTSLTGRGSFYDSVRSTSYYYTSEPLAGTNNAVTFTFSSPVVVLLIFNVSQHTLGVGIAPSQSATPSQSPTQTPSRTQTSTPTPAPDDGFSANCNMSWWSTSGSGAAAFESDVCTKGCARAGFLLTRLDRYNTAITPNTSTSTSYTQCCGLFCLSSCNYKCVCPSGSITRVSPFSMNATGYLFDSVRNVYINYVTSLTAGYLGNAVTFSILSPPVTLVFNSSDNCLGLGVAPRVDNGGKSGGGGGGGGSGVADTNSNVVGAAVGATFGALIACAACVGAVLIFQRKTTRANASSVLVKKNSPTPHPSPLPHYPVVLQTVNPIGNSYHVPPPPQPPPIPTRWFKVSQGESVWYQDELSGATAWVLPLGGVEIVAQKQQQQQQHALSTTRWQRECEGRDVWFTSVETGEAAWELPSNGIIVN